MVHHSIVIVMLMKRNSHSQGQTMEMMYEIIARELKLHNIENRNPQDYLNFYCLGNREKFATEVSTTNNSHSDNGDTVIVQNFIELNSHS